MAKKIFDASNVPHVELDGVRDALDESDIIYYETPEGSYESGMAGFWVSDDKDYQRARGVIEVFQESFTAKNEH